MQDLQNIANLIAMTLTSRLELGIKDLVVQPDYARMDCTTADGKQLHINIIWMNTSDGKEDKEVCTHLKIPE